MSYSDETVMEVHPKEVSSQARVIGEGLLNGAPDNALGRRASLVVEPNPEAGGIMARLGNCCQGRTKHGEDNAEH